MSVSLSARRSELPVEYRKLHLELRFDGIWMRLSGRDNEDSGHVVRAVAVVGIGFGGIGVLEGAATVRHPQQMVESRG